MSDIPKAAPLPELLPCPFCGSQAKLRLVGNEYFVTCTKSGVCYGFHDIYQRDRDGHRVHGYTYAQDAIDIWNRRAPAEGQLNWQRMTAEARALQARHLDKHEGDVYHAMQYLAVKFGSKEPWSLTQPLTVTGDGDQLIRN
jgi:hypothetical protein